MAILTRAGLLAVVALFSSAAMAQAPVTDRYGYCLVMKTWDDKRRDLDQDSWMSPVFEHDTPAGRLGERLEQDQKGFLAAVSAQAAVPPGADTSCVYKASRTELEEFQTLVRRGRSFGAGSGKIVMVAWAPSPLPARAAEPQRLAIDPPARALLDALAADAGFQAPAGKGLALARSGKRMAGGGGTPVPVASEMKAQRKGALCEVEQRVVAGEAEDAFTTQANGLAWAGLVPLAMDSRMSSKYAVVPSRLQAESLQRQGDPLFPLREGAKTTLVLRSRSFDKQGQATAIAMQWQCTVGATVPASGLVASATGTASELRCDFSYPEIAGAAPMAQVYHWFSDAGCFIADPTRP